MKKYLGIILIILTWLAVLLANFSANTWLTGWDNLHTEFNFAVNIQRSIFAVWQEYQGLGLLGGMGHAADLPRQIILLLASQILPVNFLRSGYFFLLLLIGPLGVYFLTKKNMAASLFYMLSLATVQTFFAPFEAFTAHYAFLPWLIYAALQLSEQPNKKNLIIFTIINIFGSTQAYIPTLFIVYFFVLAVIAVAKKSWLIIALTLVINAYWLLPFTYFTATNVNVTVEAKINQMSTGDIYLRNKEFGDLKDVITLRGFWFENKDNSGFMMEPWREHFNNLLVWVAGFALFGIVLMGIFASFKQKNPYRWIFLALFLLSFTLIANNTPPFSWIDILLYKLPLVAQVFRFPFTKSSVLLALTFSIYFGQGVYYLSRSWKIMYIPIFGLLVFYSWPIFTGNLFYKSEKLVIPQEYFQTFDFFKKQDLNTRIANFPQYTYWGWGYTNWGYNGSGFLWYGIQQPILDRAFDVWSRENENYYWEISQAVYSKNLPLLESVLNKYRVNWLLIDGNIIDPSSPKALYTDEIKSLISNSQDFKLAASFGKINIYSFNLQATTKSFVSVVQNLPSVNPSYKWGSLDQAYNDIGDYKNGSDYIYSSRTLFTGRSQTDLEFDGAKLVSGEPILQILPNKTLDSQNGATNTLAWDYRDLSHKNSYLIQVKSKNILGKPGLFWIEDLNSRRADLETYLPTKKSPCGDSGDSGKIQETSSSNSFILSEIIGFVNMGCGPEGNRTPRIKFDELIPNQSGPTPQLNISYFVLPPMEPDGLGYSFHFDNISVGKDEATNELDSIGIWQIDYWELVKQKETPPIGRMTNYSNNFVVEHPNPSLYRIDLNLPKTGTIILSQSFDSGWVAFGANNHELISNWANGWTVDSGPRVVYFFYWPQLLEFAGFGLLTIFIVGGIIVLVFSKCFSNAPKKQ